MPVAAERAVYGGGGAAGACDSGSLSGQLLAPCGVDGEPPHERWPNLQGLTDLFCGERKVELREKLLQMIGEPGDLYTWRNLDRIHNTVAACFDEVLSAHFPVPGGGRECSACSA